MEKSEIVAFIIEKVNEMKGDNAVTITADTKMITGRVLDSINTLHLISLLEEKYKFDAEAHEVNPDNLDTPTLIAEYIFGKIRA